MSILDVVGLATSNCGSFEIGLNGSNDLRPDEINDVSSTIKWV
jgi:hypothetical protein